MTRADPPSWPAGLLREDPTGVVVTVRVVPRSGASRIAGLRGDALLVRLAAAPVDGAANDELIAFLARTLGVPRRSVALVAGERARDKRLHIDGWKATRLWDCLTAAIPIPPE